MRRGQTLELRPNVRARFYRYTTIARNYLRGIINKYATGSVECEMNPESAVLAEEANPLAVLFNICIRMCTVY